MVKKSTFKNEYRTNMAEGKEGKRREEGRRNRKRKGWERKRGIKGRKKDFRF